METHLKLPAVPPELASLRAADPNSALGQALQSAHHWYAKFRELAQGELDGARALDQAKRLRGWTLCVAAATVVFHVAWSVIS